MSTFLTEIRDTLFPRLDSRDGPLPPMLVAMTVVTGLVDAFSYLVLGHVFVANMTGNVVFLAFALAGAHGFSIASSLVALGSFFIGTLGAGKLGTRLGVHRGRLLSVSAGIQAIFLGVSVILSLLNANPLSNGLVYALIIPLGLSMGIQNTTARKLAVPDLTTTVLTLTITGIGADSHFAGGSGSKAGRRLISVAAMFSGALIGALLILYSSIVYPLAIAAAMIAIVAVVTRTFSKSDSSWVQIK